MSASRIKRAALASLLAIVAGIALPGSSASASNTPWVALGDSYASGDGAGQYYGALPGEPAGCRQSSQSYPATAATWYGLPPETLAACSGETAAQMLHGPARFAPDEQPQLSQVNPGTQLVTISAGGDDLYFADVATHCLLSINLCWLEERLFYSRLASVESILIQLYSAAKKQAAPGALIVVVGYPGILPASTSNGCGIWRRESINSMRRMYLALDGAIAVAAAAARVNYLDMRLAFQNHDICSNDAWVNPAQEMSVNPIDPLRTPLHPNPTGYDQMAKLLAQYVHKHHPAPFPAPPPTGDLMIITHAIGSNPVNGVPVAVNGSVVEQYQVLRGTSPNTGVPVAGAGVDFSLDGAWPGGCGSMQPSHATSDGSGIVTVTYTAGPTSGFCSQHVQITGGTISQGFWQFFMQTTQPALSYVGTATASRTTLPADGVSTSTVTLSVRDAAGGAVVNDPVFFQQAAPAATGGCGVLTGLQGITQGALVGMVGYTDATGQLSFTFTAGTTKGTCFISWAEAFSGRWTFPGAANELQITTT